MNFYSSGEEVLRNYPGPPPIDLVSAAYSQVIATAQGAQGAYTWVWQEKTKGLMLVNNIIGSNHGGWKFNDVAYGTNVVGGNQIYTDHMSPQAATLLTASQLQTNPFFALSSDLGSGDPFTADVALLGSSGSTYAQANRNRILSDAIPCLTLPVGANHDTNLDLIFGETRNFDMQISYENGWPLGRHQPQYPIGTTAAGEWHHSDVRAVAYTFTYPLFNKIATVGNLK